MNVISNAMLLVRRINELQRRRDNLLERQERLRRTLPEWTFAPLQLVGMSADEIRGMMSDLTDAERSTGLDQLEAEVEKLDQQIEELENSVLTTPSRSLDSIQAVLDLAVSRFKAHTVADPNDVFYDYGDARVLFFLERAAEDLRALLNEEQRQAG
ncbi:MAG TPA: hypothetical protein PKA13_25735 [Geminicoccaceae bacterium]|nr:hypothetical protein [Geminicoccus sp.]HMU53200.1 hypothetical protein [Geminicoccaceae bacterium]